MPNPGYTDAEKREVLRQYLLQGTYQKASEALGVPVTTISSWKFHEREWWDRTINELVTEMEGEYRPGWVRVMGLAVEALQERLEHGDTRVVGKEKLRVPVTAKDAAVIAGIAADKLKQFGLQAPTSKEAATERQERLRAIAQKDRAERAGAVQ